jgi:hypothetical protein
MGMIDRKARAKAKPGLDLGDIRLDQALRNPHLQKPDVGHPHWFLSRPAPPALKLRSAALHEEVTA